MSNPDELLDILKERLASRVIEMTESDYVPDSTQIADLAAHYNAVRAAEWFIKEYSGFLN